MKVVAKKKLHDARLDNGTLQERKYHAVLNGGVPCIPHVLSTLQTEKLAYLVYSDVFVCDLALVISSETSTVEEKVYYAGCVYSAVMALHDNGLMHRFVNSSSVYLTEQGVPKLCDFR